MVVTPTSLSFTSTFKSNDTSFNHYNDNTHTYHSGHPYLPFLATSGLETAAKLWKPTGEQKHMSVTATADMEGINVRTVRVVVVWGGGGYGDGGN